MAPTARLAEFVSLLTGCEAAGALHAVREQEQAQPVRQADPLAVVARAMVAIDRPAPPGFRVAGYLRTDLPRAAVLEDAPPSGVLCLPRRCPRRHFDVFD